VSGFFFVRRKYIYLIAVIVDVTVLGLVGGAPGGETPLLLDSSIFISTLHK